MMTVLLAVLIVASGLMLVSGIVWNGFTNPNRHVMSREEAIEFSSGRPRRAGGAGRLRSASWWSWFKGWAVGFSFFDTMSFGEIKSAIAAGDWRRSHRLQQFILAGLGGLMLVCSVALLVGWLTRPIGLVVAILLVTYVVVQMTLGISRAK
jgi:hypothetical protein